MTTPTGAPPSGLARGGDGTAWHALSTDSVLSAEQVDEREGLSSAEVQARAQRFGPNELEEGARRTSFRGLVASGWHTAAVTMRLIVDSDLGLGGQGAGLAVEAMQWRLPVRAGDALRVEGTVTEARPSRSRPQSGIVKFQVTTFNQRDEAVLEATHVVMVARRSV